MQFSDVVIPLRAAWSSPFVRWQGPTADLSSLDLAAQVTRRALDEREVEWPITELILGMTIPQRECFYGAPTLAARLGFSGVSGPMIAQACATSVASLHAAATSQSIENGGGARLVVTTDRTSNGPHLVYPRTSGPGGTVDSENWVMDAFGRDPNTGEGMLATAERVAADAGFDKPQLDELTAVRYAQYEDSLAQDRAFQRKWLVPIEAGTARRPHLIEDDQGVRPTTLKELEALKPVSPDGVVSFGTQTHPADGTAGFIVTSPAVARERGVTGPLARIMSTGFARVPPGTMPKAPVPAAAALLERIHELDDPAGARRPLRMPVDEAAAVRVHPLGVDPGLAREPQVVDRERVVGLDQVDLVQREPGVLQRGRRGGHRRLGHLPRLHAREAGGQHAGDDAVGAVGRRDDEPRAAIGRMRLRAVGDHAVRRHRRQRRERLQRRGTHAPVGVDENARGPIRPATCRRASRSGAPPVGHP
ncbi:MAG TPA: hypothetical protein VJU80_00325 [Solirubrobacteraceae bacterium]|nr:hypothetical protein [Solirubrobacteraceae bacterium]